nr:unnamed protein product [Callosobruchus chinensis]
MLALKPSELKRPWILGKGKDAIVTEISKENIPSLKNYHLIGIEFLYQNFVKKGSIINSEEGLDIQFQVSLFIKALQKSSRDDKCLVLVLTPDHLLITWHYHLIVDGGFSVKIITEDDSANVIAELDNTVILLPFSCIKAAESLIDYDYSVVVVDHLDEIANKLVLRKIFGKFNIGLTRRNFYLKPDQKLQWTMLNWANPGCVGKLADFYEIDNDNFANFRDNYRFWWLRITWKFCESFERKTDEEIEKYDQLLAKWASSHELLKYQFKDQRKSKRSETSGNNDKRKKSGNDGTQTISEKNKKSKGRKFNTSKTIGHDFVTNTTKDKIKSDVLQQPTNGTSEQHRRCDESITSSVLDREETSQPNDISGNFIGKIYSCKRRKTQKKLEVSQSGISRKSSTSSLERLKEEEPKSQIDMHEKITNSIQKPKTESITMDDNPILSFFMDDDDSENKSDVLKIEPSEKDVNVSNYEADDDILRSIMDDTDSKTTTAVIEQDGDLFHKKEEILSQIYDTGDRTRDIETDFLSTLIDF